MLFILIVVGTCGSQTSRPSWAMAATAAPRERKTCDGCAWRKQFVNNPVQTMHICVQLPVQYNRGEWPPQSRDCAGSGKCSLATQRYSTVKHSAYTIQCGHSSTSSLFVFFEITIAATSTSLAFASVLTTYTTAEAEVNTAAKTDVILCKDIPRYI
jgi:hypothetical protein